MTAIGLAGVVFVSLLRLAPPTLDTLGFPTDRAMQHLKFIASEPHPVGSPHHQAVRQYLASQLEQLGFNVKFQQARSPIPLTNILARKAGTDPSQRAIALAAHYDSARLAPGAGDNGAAVAATLEAARVLVATPHRNDLILLLSDGEEMGLWGAKIFVQEPHPWLADIAVLLNFDARGTRGPSIMFETTDNNTKLIELFARHAPRPVCSSLSADVYRYMPNRTDFTIFRNQTSIAGLNFAFIGGVENYHQKTDDPDHLDPSSLRHHGLLALSLASALLEMDPDSLRSSGDSVYFDLLSLFVVHYPRSWVPYIAILATLLAIASMVLAIRSRRLSILSLIPAMLHTLLTIATIFFFQGGSYLFAWPLMAGSIGILLALSRPLSIRPVAGAGILFAASTVRIVLVAPMLFLAIQGLQLSWVWSTVIWVIFAGSIWPPRLKYPASAEEHAAT